MSKHHQTSIRYSAETLKFSACGLSEEYANGYYAPFVKESKITIGAGFGQKIIIEENGAIMIIGKIHLVMLPEDCIKEDGFLALKKARALNCSGLDSYHTTERLSRLSNAKPDKNLSQIMH